MINDGFGELSDVEKVLLEEEDFIVRNARHALVKKMGRSFSEGLDEDAIQEARIAAWQSWIKHQNRAYLNIAVRQRLVAHVYRDQWFGTKPTAHEMDPIRRSSRDSLDDPDIDVVLTANESLEAVLMAYHDGEIVEAINALSPTQREYVVLRFWCGMTNPEIAAVQGKTPSGVSSIWSKAIRPSLLERLSHLVEV